MAICAHHDHRCACRTRMFLCVCSAYVHSECELCFSFMLYTAMVFTDVRTCRIVRPKDALSQARVGYGQAALLRYRLCGTLSTAR